MDVRHNTIQLLLNQIVGLQRDLRSASREHVRQQSMMQRDLNKRDEYIHARLQLPALKGILALAEIRIGGDALTDLTNSISMFLGFDLKFLPHLRCVARLIPARVDMQRTHSQHHHVIVEHVPKGIFWNEKRRCWIIHFSRKNAFATRRRQEFSIEKHLVSGGLTWEEARAAAYKEASDAHADLVAKGFISVDDAVVEAARRKKAKVAQLKQQRKTRGIKQARRAMFEQLRRRPRSGVAGIVWLQMRASWNVQLHVPRLKKLIYGSRVQPISSSAQDIQIAFSEGFAKLQDMQREYGVPMTKEGKWHWVKKDMKKTTSRKRPHPAKCRTERSWQPQQVRGRSTSRLAEFLD